MQGITNDICMGDKVNLYEPANVHQQLTYLWIMPLLTLPVSINGLPHYPVVVIELLVLSQASEQLFIEASEAVN